MSRPSELQVSLALDVLNAEATADQRRALAVLRRALAPRLVWMAKEVADAVGADPSNLKPGKMVGFELLAKPFQVLPRPTSANPDRVTRLWFADQVMEHPKAKELAARPRAARSGT